MLLVPFRLTVGSSILAILTTIVKAGDFLQPFTSGSTKDYSDNINYAVGVSILTEWVADFTNARINLNQDNKPGDAQGGPSVLLEEGYDEKTWRWTVSYAGIDPTYNNVFYFSVTQADGSDSFTSHYFNISERSSTTTTSSATTARSTASLASLSTTSASTTPTSSELTPSPATVTVAPPSDGGTPIGTIAGMVVGIVVGSLLLVGGAWWAWKVKKRRDAPASSAQAPSTVAAGQPYSDWEPLKPYEADGNQVHELHAYAGQSIHELQDSVRHSPRA
ncbi:MAG: hypothetical protein LQ348_000853 [Seirophora lacunosa]|nr:MAG: hypothetical protein LQ348_000853 [Seirophora lacunosa]